ncbi:hypothetical protein NE236_29735 [Actinoallomurus purpureus]|uniref:hypothetical protein n=1 Tax=Actinoallomurus purpureus TaxID=478114 RepID=UPI002092D730|nr:hypothetical protein [Actinoallomurus purpureus]MCO6009159.1 hypothetical protein [Actinoallomurus purpureus]
MPKMTDYVREGFNRRRRPWHSAELPEWWNVAVWVALAGIGVMLLVSALLEPGESAGDTTGTARPPAYSVQKINPYATPSASEGSAAGTPTPDASSPPGDGPGGDFSATAAVQVPKAGGGTAVVPAGARNVALAAAKAAATGDWTGIPFIGRARPPKAPRTPQGSVIGQPTVTDPSITGNTQYLFSATITHGGAAKGYQYRVAVERDQSGYAVRAQ